MKYPNLTPVGKRGSIPALQPGLRGPDTPVVFCTCNLVARGVQSVGFCPSGLLEVSFQEGLWGLLGERGAMNQRPEGGVIPSIVWNLFSQELMLNPGQGAGDGQGGSGGSLFTTGTASRKQPE